MTAALIDVPVYCVPPAPLIDNLIKNGSSECFQDINFITAITTTPADVTYLTHPNACENPMLIYIEVYSTLVNDIL